MQQVRYFAAIAPIILKQIMKIIEPPSRLGAASRREERQEKKQKSL